MRNPAEGRKANRSRNHLQAPLLNLHGQFSSCWNCLTISVRWSGSKPRKVVLVRKVIKKKKTSTGLVAVPSTPVEPEQKATCPATPVEYDKVPGTPSTLPYGRFQSHAVLLDHDQHHYDGAYSQWREEAPDMWHLWDWPPKGWRPSKWQRSYWDSSDPYYGYNTYTWDREEWWNPSSEEPSTSGTETQTPPPGPGQLRSPDTVSTLLSRSDSELARVNETIDGLQRANTVEQVTFEQKLNQAAEPSPGEGQGNLGEEAKESEVEPDDRKQNGTAPSHEAPAPPKKDNKGQQQVEPSASQEADAEAQITEEQLKDHEKRRKAAKARYMRYYRSIRSQSLSVNRKNISTASRNSSKMCLNQLSACVGSLGSVAQAQRRPQS